MFVTNRIKDDVEEMFERIDENGDGSISFEEFASLMLEMDHTKAVAGLRVSFDTIDQDRDGCVSFGEFREWVSR